MTSSSSSTKVPGWKWFAVFAAGVAVALAIVFAIGRNWFPGQTTKTSPKDIPQFVSDGIKMNNVPNNPAFTIRTGTPKAIDGKLNDWNLDGKYSFHIYPDATRVFADPKWHKEFYKQLLKEYYSVQGAMMEDSTNLYIGVKIGDYDKLLFNNDDPKKVFNLDNSDGKSPAPQNYLQILISSHGVDSDTKPVGKITDDEKKRAFNLALWRSSTKKMAFLEILPGVGPLAPKRIIPTNEDGFECVFNQVGNDCIIEAKIPWSVIQHPAPDTTKISCLWQVIRQIDGSRIRLVEFANYSERPKDANGAAKKDTKGELPQFLDNMEATTNDEFNPIRMWGRIDRQPVDRQSN